MVDPFRVGARDSRHRKVRTQLLGAKRFVCADTHTVSLLTRISLGLKFQVPLTFALLRLPGPLRIRVIPSL